MLTCNCDEDTAFLGCYFIVACFTSVIPGVMQVQLRKIKSEVYVFVSLTFCLIENVVVHQPPDCWWGQSFNETVKTFLLTSEKRWNAFWYFNC